jgi:hypothetical protein
MKEKPKRRIAVTSSLNEITTDQLGNRVVVRGGSRYRTMSASALPLHKGTLDGLQAVLWIQILRIRMFLGLLDPNPSIIKQSF